MRNWHRSLITYLKEHGYNYVEIMPLCEYPCDESWGYQDTGYFSPTSRYGKPEELKAFVDQCHQAGIGVILDFVPVHFAVNDYALAEYDGTALYEYPNMAVGRNEWGSCNFMHSRGEVCSFLQSSAYYWMNEFHFDGLRMDAVGNLIYWQGDASRGENLAALKFIRTMNQGLKERIPDCLLFAEDSTPYQGVTKPVWEGGLGFDYKWNMGWMNDFLNYMKLDPLYRKYHHNDLTFSMVYAYSEKFILVLSHDEVVHEKGSMIAKMPGGYEDKFSNLRVAYGYMMTHPGKKLLFMGQEIAQFTEFNENAEVDWSLFEFDAHVFMQGYVKELNELYKTEPALYELDSSPEGFTWINCNSANTSLLSYVRKGKKESDTLLIICNFTPSGTQSIQACYSIRRKMAGDFLQR